jgi:hypothetical protein
VRLAEVLLELDAYPAWSGAFNTVVVKKGVVISELRCVGKCWASGNL